MSVEAEIPAKGALINGKTAFYERHWIRGYEVEPDRMASVVSVGNLLQVIATAQDAAAYIVLTAPLKPATRAVWFPPGMCDKPCSVALGPERGARFCCGADNG